MKVKFTRFYAPEPGDFGPISRPALWRELWRTTRGGFRTVTYVVVGRPFC